MNANTAVVFMHDKSDFKSKWMRRDKDDHYTC